MDIKWQRGNFLKFTARMRIRVGGNSPLELISGDEFEYDGSILKYSGMEIPQSQLRGAISSGWAILTGGDDGQQIESVQPNRNIAKAQTVNKDLLNVQRAGSSRIVASQQDESEVLRVGDRSTDGTRNPRIVTSSDNRRNMPINSGASDDQGAVAIGRVRTSAKQIFSDVSRSDAASKLNELENPQPSRAQLYDKTIVKEGVTIKTNLGNINRISEVEDDEGTHVANVRTSGSHTSEGVEILDTSSTRIQKTESSKPTKAVEKAFSINTGVDPRLRVARAIYPEFPESWVFAGKLADRLHAAKSYSEDPRFLEALFAAEGDQFRKVLISEYPGQFLP